MKKILLAIILTTLIPLGDYVDTASYDDIGNVCGATEAQIDAISDVITEGNLIDDDEHKLAYKTIQASYETICLGTFSATAYCACAQCCGQWATSSPSITASGTTCQEGRTLSVDTAVISLGSEVILEYPDGTRQTYVAEDTGSAIKGNKLDVYFASHQAALEYGRRDVTVYIVNK